MNMMMILLLAASLAQAPARAGRRAGRGQAEAEAARPLFNGKDLGGWTDLLDNGSEWWVEDGLLMARGGGAGHPAVLLADREDYKDFRLRVVFGCPEPGGGGIEVRRTGSGNVTDCYWISAFVGADPGTASWPAGSLIKLSQFQYGVSSWPQPRPTRRAQAAINVWHTLDVTVIGDRITTVLDGQPAADYVEKKSRGNRGGGGIALFCRGNAQLRVKSIDIRELAD